MLNMTRSKAQDEREVQAACNRMQNEARRVTARHLKRGDPAINLGASAACMLDDALAGRHKACQRGCTWCCTHPVGAMPSEIFMLATALRLEYRDRPDAYAAEVLSLRAAAERGAPYREPVSYRRAQIMCPFVQDDGGCGVYEFRPIVCRGHTSADVAHCRQSYVDPTHPIDVDRVFELATVALLMGVVQATGAAKRVARPYDFLPALVYALEHPEAEAVWAAGGEPFPGCRPALMKGAA